MRPGTDSHLERRAAGRQISQDIHGPPQHLRRAHDPECLVVAGRDLAGEVVV